MPAPKPPKLTSRRLKADAEIGLHFRTLVASVAAKSDSDVISASLEKHIGPSQRLFRLHGVHLRPLSYESLDLSDLKVPDVGVLNPSEDQLRLATAFGATPSVRRRTVAVFLVDSIRSPSGIPLAGCSYSVDQLPCVLLATKLAITGDQSTSPVSWTFGHEIGHLLGLAHQGADSGMLMSEDTSKIKTGSHPLLTWAELLAVRSHPLLRII